MNGNMFAVFVAKVSPMLEAYRYIFIFLLKLCNSFFQNSRFMLERILGSGHIAVVTARRHSLVREICNRMKERILARGHTLVVHVGGASSRYDWLK
ncbi:unnamed protein product [Strongylus vulgaris]|uniref:Uncharacterized protein n=1 Tax=Strongylus vulgaris TaxID=40348 RepID=A0A3P7IE31_STRVU|nr:unnamed protein product [Strongylus vulgaris]